VPNVCKSSGEASLGKPPSGKRLSDTSATCPEVGDNRGKLRLIPHVEGEDILSF
jgi:hypothetical protein